MNSSPDVAPMHFDWDFKQVLLVQHYGRKRVVLFSPKFSKRFLPIANMSFIAFHQLNEEEQSELIKYCHGEEFLLEPGDALLIPRCWWHFIEYIDFGIGSNYRFDGGTEDRLLT
jgi:ribosomal protein L16 Arg81 hydroxylase